MCKRVFVYERVLPFRPYFVHIDPDGVVWLQEPRAPFDYRLSIISSIKFKSNNSFNIMPYIVVQTTRTAHTRIWEKHRQNQKRNGAFDSIKANFAQRRQNSEVGYMHGYAKKKC